MSDQHGDVDMHENEAASPEELRHVEDDLLSTVLEAAEQRTDDTEVVRIVRKGKPVFYFRVRGVDEHEDAAARKEAQVYHAKGKPNRLGGMRVPDDFDNARYRSRLIITATTAFCEPTRFDDVPIDKARPEQGTRNIAVEFNDVPSLWDNSELRKKLAVVDERDIVDKVLKPGEKAHVLDVIDKLSGHGEELDEELGN